MANGMEIRQQILTRMMKFTADLDAVLKKLPTCLAKDKLQDQLGRSGSSVGANYAESRAAESTKDFIHKLSIALKEAEETDFWLGCKDSSEFNHNCKEKSQRMRHTLTESRIDSEGRRWSDGRMLRCSDDNTHQSRENTKVESGFPVSGRILCA